MNNEQWCDFVESVEATVNQIAYNTYRSHFDNELLMVDSELNMAAAMSEFFDLDEGPEPWTIIDQTMDRIKSIEQALEQALK